MKYFDNFPEVPYKFATSGTPKTVNFTNLTVHSDVFSQLGDDSTIYNYYNIQNGERPDIVSDRLYGTPEYYWTFYLLNPDIRHCGWPLSEFELKRHMESKIPGECLVILPQDEVDLGNDTNFLQHQMIEQFPIGSAVIGSTSGAVGTVYARNVNLGQLFVQKTNGGEFVNNEVIVNSVSSPTNSLTIRILHNPAYLAVHHFEDGDGDHVDVDYALDFRGRADETVAENVSGLPDGAGPGPDGNYIGGVVGDITNPDPYATASPYTTVTHKDHYEQANNSLSRLKIVRPGLIAQYVSLFKESIRT